MALNWTMLKPDRTPVPLPEELTIMTVEPGAEVSLAVPDTPPAGSSTSGGSGGARKLNGTGKLFLTDQRLIFVSESDVGSTGFDTLNLPLPSILSTRPSPDGGLTAGTKSEIRLKDQGIFQFVSLLEKTRERAVYMKRQIRDEEESLPAYASPVQGTSRRGGTPVDAPPSYEE